MNTYHLENMAGPKTKLISWPVG